MAATCINCGAALVYPVVLDGKIYGRDCAAYQLGIHPNQLIVRGETVDRGAIAAAKAKAAERRAASERHAAELAAREDANRVTYAWLIDVLKADSWGYCMVESVVYGGIAGLSPKALRVAQEIYGKRFGRKGSKAYYAAIDAQAWT